MGSDIVKVFVGQERKLYQLHKTLLCAKYPYFQKCLGSSFEEGCKGEVVLEEENPCLFDNLVLWLYSQPLTKEAFDEAVGVRTYLLADRFCMEGFKNYIVDRIRECDGRYILRLGPVKYLVKHGPEGCQLLEYCIRQLAYEIVCNGFGHYMKEFVEDVSIAEAGADLLSLLLPKVDEAYSAKEDGSLEEPAGLKGCHFHYHKDTEPCKSE